MGHNKLTDQQEGYAQDIGNKKYKHHWEAYQANYNSDKMSRNAIYVEACRLLQNPKVALRVKEIEDKIKEQEKVTLDEIIIKLSQRVNLDIRKMFNDDDSFKSINELTQDQAMFIHSFEVSEIWGMVDGVEGKKERQQIGVLKKVKLESIKDMLDMLIKHYGGYAKDNEGGSSDIEAVRDIVESCLKR